MYHFRYTNTPLRTILPVSRKTWRTEIHRSFLLGHRTPFTRDREVMTRVRTPLFPGFEPRNRTTSSRTNTNNASHIGTSVSKLTKRWAHNLLMCFKHTRYSHFEIDTTVLSRDRSTTMRANQHAPISHKTANRRNRTNAHLLKRWGAIAFRDNYRTYIRYDF